MPLPRSLSQKLLLLSNAVLLGAVALLLAGRQPAEVNALVASRAAGSPRDIFQAKSPIAAVAHAVSPSVVTIGAVRSTKRPVYRDFFNLYYQRVDQQFPYLGSGALIDRDGHIVTNWHVVEGAEKIFVTLMDGRRFDATLLDADQLLDVALLRIQAPDLPDPIEFGDSDALQIGETVIALGNPFGPIMQDPRPTVTTGVVSATNRTFRPDVEKQKVYRDMVQTDAPINPGNSGGPLVDITGRMIGLNTFIVSSSGTSAGIGFAIPGNRVREIVEEIKKHGHLRPVLKDFDFAPIRTNRIQGMLVHRLAERGPAARAGLREGDVIVGADGHELASPAELPMLLTSKQVGETMALKVWRDGELLDLRYQISEAPRRRSF
jgi:serine protease Do